MDRRFTFNTCGISKQEDLLLCAAFLTTDKSYETLSKTSACKQMISVLNNIPSLCLCLAQQHLRSEPCLIPDISFQILRS